MTKKVLAPIMDSMRLSDVISNNSKNYDEFLGDKEKIKHDKKKQNIARFKEEKPLRGSKKITDVLSNSFRKFVNGIDPIKRKASPICHI